MGCFKVNEARLVPMIAPSAPKSIGPYSPGMMTSGRGQAAYIAGQIALDPNNPGQLVGTTVEEQTEQAIKNVESVLKVANLTLANVANVTIYLTDFKDFDAMNTVYMSRFAEPRPARATVAVKELPKKALVEIVATAFIPNPTLLERSSAYVAALVRKFS